jgi:signal transduction histidine kinase/CheY-like chemotaxis protein
MTSQEPLLLHDVFEDEELLGQPSIANLSLHSVLCVPMLRGGELLGVMYADTSSSAAAFDKTDLEVFSLFAEQAAAAIHSNRLLETVQRSYQELQSLQERLVRGERLRVIGEISSGVAHEFNNLLTAILARIQMMSLGYLPADARRDLDLIEKAALDAAEVVRRLQTFSRQQRQANFTLVDIADVCRDAVDLMRPLWRGRRPGHLGVELESEPDLFVRGDPTELREVLTNLLKNAIDASPTGGTIRVQAASRQGRIHLRVSDQGMGIPPEMLPRIFDPFFTTKGERGTGLGLCLSQQIVERHGGRIEARSEAGKGTEFRINLPATERTPAAVEVTATSPDHQGRSLRIVVVDDDGEVLTPLCSYLERCGYQVVSASNAFDGLKTIETSPPDIVLTDIGMPGMDGIELCRRVHETLPRLPIILMSGWASDVDPNRARAAGARALIAKPFAMQQVTDLLRSLVST